MTTDARPPHLDPSCFDGPAELDLAGLNLGLLTLVTEALKEDALPSDLTTRLTIPRNARGKAAAVARSPLVVSGLEPFRLAFTLVDHAVSVAFKAADGQRLEKGEAIAEIEGPAASILTAERVALNFLGLLSGVATLTAEFVAAVKAAAGPNPPSVIDTRKTTPLLRSLEKAAVVHGGGRNHRFNLHDGILIKDNHIKAAGSITAALALAKAGRPHLTRIEVEVDDLAQLREALTAGAEAVLLDNMDPAALSKAVEITDQRFRPGPRTVILEASGGITLESVGAVAKTGVDFISVGAITRSAPWADVGLDWLS
jgi:nicotinate-nucleotide pyrophosphorylase (carboxylating)